MSLLPLSRLIANGALELGGGVMRYYKAIFCPGVRDDGTPCFSEKTGAAWTECPVCRGKGMLYDKPVTFKGVYTDNSNTVSYNPEGVLMQGSKSLSIPYWIKPTVLKPRASGNNMGTSRVLRDKFVMISPEGTPTETVFLLNETVDPTINGGEIYRIIEVESNI